MANMTRNIPLSLDDELLAEIDRIAEETKESRSAIMRRAIREGLPLVKVGRGADVITLDGETSKDVDTTSKEAGISRPKVIIEAIRTGLQATYYRLMRDRWVRAQDQNPKESEHWIHLFERQLQMEDPMGQELRAALRQRGAVLVRFHDLLEHVPEAFRRYQLVERLTEICHSPGGRGGGVWGMGLSTEEVEWQVQMHEKYGQKSIPEHEAQARAEARDREDKTHRQIAFEATHGKPVPEK